jgi:beta-galactosidase
MECQIKLIKSKPIIDDSKFNRTNRIALSIKKLIAFTGLLFSVLLSINQAKARMVTVTDGHTDTIKLLNNALSNAKRYRFPLNKRWDFHYTYDIRKNYKATRVDIPHTWNAAPGKDTSQYNRISAIYEKKLVIDRALSNKRLFLYFEGVNTVGDIFINKHYVTTHKGGYTAFCVEITPWVLFNSENEISVHVSNSFRYDVLPLAGDFNLYGGIHRPVSLLVTSANCITPLDYGASGLYLKQSNVSERVATVDVAVKLSIKSYQAATKVLTQLRDSGNRVLEEHVAPLKNGDLSIVDRFIINQPHLWNAKSNPYLYRVTVKLLENGVVSDAVTEHLGLRYYRVDPQLGFFLNGKHMDINGICRHEDVYNKGSALDSLDQKIDFNLIMEMLANAVSLTHYPQSRIFYDLCDKKGLIVWSEIPLIGPGGYHGVGYINNPELKQQARQVLTEMIRQNYNRPSIFFWGIFNELKLDYDDPVSFVRELDSLTKKEDPSRLTTCATFLDDGTFNNVTDLIGWNKYYGWYSGVPGDLGVWADQMHAKYPQKPIGVSEYGAGGSPNQHDGFQQNFQPGGRFHPEESQAFFHESNWAELRTRPFLWGRFIWLLADMESAIRNEGELAGINDKGLVTYDRKIKKDAFYFYKANWNPEPMLYLTQRRYRYRLNNIISVKAYTNLPSSELFVNGISYGIKKKDSIGRVIWDKVLLNQGINKIRVTSKAGRQILNDGCVWEVTNNLNKH